MPSAVTNDKYIWAAVSAWRSTAANVVAPETATTLGPESLNDSGPPSGVAPQEHDRLHLCRCKAANGNLLPASLLLGYLAVGTIIYVVYGVRHSRLGHARLPRAVPPADLDPTHPEVVATVK